MIVVVNNAKKSIIPYLRNITGFKYNKTQKKSAKVIIDIILTKSFIFHVQT